MNIDLNNIRKQIKKTEKEENKDPSTFTLTVNKRVYEEIENTNNQFIYIEGVTDIKVDNDLTDDEFYLNPNKLTVGVL